MENKAKYWKGFEELNKDPEFLQYQKNEFAEGLPLDEVLNENNLSLSSNRRDFLKFFGFSVSAVALAACNKAPVKNVIPYVVKPEEITPGVPNWYASTFNGTSVLVKTREGRPIKLEGNPLSPLTQGGVDAYTHASLLNLYDTKRNMYATKDAKEVDWKDADAEIIKSLNEISAAGQAIALVTPSISSPSTSSVISQFKAKFATTNHISYDAVSYAGILVANERSFGKKVIPNYRFDLAKTIVSFGADFLGTWLNTNQYSRQWAKNRNLKNGEKSLSKHYQFEAILSLTGSNADYRAPLKPSSEAAAIATLYNEIAKLAGWSALNAPKVELAGNTISLAAKDLWENKGQSLVVSGSNDVNVQILVNQINTALSNIGKTVDLDNYYKNNSADDSAFANFVSELSSGKYGAVIFAGVNPVYTHPTGNKLAEAIKKAKLSVSTAYFMDETAKACKFVCPDNHWLESWADSEPVAGHFLLSQPTIQLVFNTRQTEQSLLTWAGVSTNYYDLIKSNWQTSIFPTQNKYSSFTEFWNNSLHNGMYVKNEITPNAYGMGANAAEALANALAYKPAAGLELVAYQKVSIRNGEFSDNPWLQELPDPITKVTWDNYASLSKSTADELGVKDGDLVKVTTANQTIESLPVLVQPGQARGTVAIAIGYGANKEGSKEVIGANIYPSVAYRNETFQFNNGGVKVEKISGEYELARTQTHHSIEGRDIVREAPLPNYIQNPGIRNEDKLGILRDKNQNLVTLWEEFDNKGHKWGMAIDLNLCTGCGACIVSCNAENNVPVVGREEVRRRREMHWIRIDRYYRFNPSKANEEYQAEDEKSPGFKGVAKGAFNSATNEYLSYGTTREDVYTKFDNYDEISVTHVPMMCQHCGHAPCETVCPVLATTHSSEGLNQMTYNRCIGTKYCANNCPYKVRRFNWFRYNDNDNFDYYLNNDLGKMVINPDVTVRTRGVMEKCSFCVQRIQYGKLQAKLENRAVKDGDIKTACQQSCPTGALVFGDLKDPNSEISKLFRNERSYAMLEELNIQPSVVYMTKIRNTEEDKTVKAHAEAH